MQIDVLTLFPGMFASVLGESMMKRAQAKGLAKIRVHDLRKWTFDAHRTADDKPFGGGPGMVMKVEPVYLALQELGALSGKGLDSDQVVLLLTPQGKRFDQNCAKRISSLNRLVLVCGHYEGVDERIRGLVDEEISIGDYVLTCGELPALVAIDCIVRLIPGVLGRRESLTCESFESGLLEYPHYTRPAEFKGMKVPQVLLSGNHKKIEAWRCEEAEKRTSERRPDLLLKKRHKKNHRVDGQKGR